MTQNNKDKERVEKVGKKEFSRTKIKIYHHQHKRQKNNGAMENHSKNAMLSKKYFVSQYCTRVYKSLIFSANFKDFALCFLNCFAIRKSFVNQMKTNDSE